jgi:hypothetical protein
MAILSGLTISGGGVTITDGGAPATDPYFMYNSLLLPGNGTNTAQNNTFLDGSTNNFTITRNGNTTQGTFSPYGSNWSNYFDGTGDYLTASNNAAFNFETGNFTVECWVYVTSFTGSTNVIVSTYQDGTNGWTIGISSNVFYGAAAGDIAEVRSSVTPQINTWTHLALTRSSTTLSLFINGVVAATLSNSTNMSTTSAVTIGTNVGGGALNFKGYISNLRIVKGTAVYTSNFTPSTTPLTAIANTSLLTCADNRFIDDSTNNFTITKNGDVSVQRFSPFSPAAAYSAGTIGGGGYFDGTGDYLSLASNAAFTVGTGAVTIEAWIYCTSLTQPYQGIIGGRLQDAITGYPGLSLVIDDSKLFFTIMGISTGLVDTVNVSLNQWIHVVGVRSGTNAALFVNGVRKAFSASNSTNGTTSNMAIGRYYSADDGYYFSGYISDARIVKGTAVYDPTVATLTVPTAPLTAITNTSLLLNYTNAGIIDNTMINNLETVGNVQISTAQSQFGGGSMYFDGTGDYLLPRAGPQYAFGTGDFTVECWIYATNPNVSPIYEGRNSGSSGAAGFTLTAFSSSSITIFAGGYLIQSTGTTYVNIWTHVAVVKSGATTTLYINGISAGTTSGITNITDQSVLIGGGRYDSGSTITASFTGYIDDFRITNGYARYTSNFTPPTTAFPLN